MSLKTRSSRTTFLGYTELAHKLPLPPIRFLVLDPVRKTDPQPGLAPSILTILNQHRPLLSRLHLITLHLSVARPKRNHTQTFAQVSARNAADVITRASVYPP